MNARLTVTAFGLILLVFGTLVVEAQPSRFRDQFERRGRRRSRSRLRSRSNTNQSHERAKSMAASAYKRGDYERVNRLTTSVLRENPRDHLAYYWRASARCELGFRRGNGKLLRQGISDARESLRYDAGKTPLYYIPYIYGTTCLAMVENRQSHAKLALDVANQTLALPRLKAETKAHLYFQRARTQSYLGDFSASITDYQAAIRHSKSLLSAHFGLAEAYASAGKPEKALQTFDQAVAAFPNNPLVYDNRGVFQQSGGKTSDAIADFTRAIELNPKYISAYNNRGFTLMEQGELKAAESDLSASLRINPSQPAAYGLRSGARLAQGKLRGAIDDRRQVVTLTPGDGIAHADLGFATFFAGDYSAALSSFNRASALDSTIRYLGPWQYAALAASGRLESNREQFAAQIDKPADRRNWIDNLLAYLDGRITQEELVKTLHNSDSSVRDAQLCEAFYFIGLRKKLDGQLDDAKMNFEKALKTNAHQLSAYRGAQYALKKFKAPQSAR